jgi:hypothetical protein
MGKGGRMFNIGLTEAILLSVILLVIALPIWAVFDAAIRPDEAWQAAEQNKVVWVLVILFMPLVGSILYFVAIRPKVRAGGAS